MGRDETSGPADRLGTGSRGARPEGGSLPVAGGAAGQVDTDRPATGLIPGGVPSGLLQTGGPAGLLEARPPVSPPGTPRLGETMVAEGPRARLPIMPGFREMALRRMSQERGRLMRDLAARRQEAGLSQTEVAARMGTSQSAVARLESGETDVRASTLERYAAALGTEITWKIQG